MGANSPYTHTKVLKAVWERAPTQYGIELQYNMGANSPYTHKGSMGAGEFAPNCERKPTEGDFNK